MVGCFILGCTPLRPAVQTQEPVALEFTGIRPIKKGNKNFLCEQAPNEVFIFLFGTAHCFHEDYTSTIDFFPQL